jgi:hypothetical protein
MSRGLEPTEEYDGSITVRLATDSGERDQIRCASYTEAISVVKDHQHEVTVSTIVARDGEIVFDSADMNIDDWETEWQHAKRRLSVDVEEHECLYENVACVADDLCVKCKMDKVQTQH